MKGVRKLYVYTVGVVALLGGLGLCIFAPPIVVAYAAFATAVVALATSVVLGNVGEHFAGKGKAE